MTGELDFLILITLNISLNSHICWLVATILDKVILNLSLRNYTMGLITEPSLLGSLRTEQDGAHKALSLVSGTWQNGI